ncbi:MAG: MASE1 domain-containing protein, partial [Pseudomonadota bacterium]
MTNKFKTLAIAFGLALLSGLSYFLLGQFGALFTIPSTALSVFWPPDAATLAILLLSPRRYWPFILVGSWLGDFPNEFTMSGSFRDAMILATLDSLMVLMPAFIIRCYAGDITVRNSIRWFAWLFVSYGLFSVPLIGLIAALTVYGHEYTFVEIANNIKTFSLSAISSGLILVPLIVASFETLVTRPESPDIDWRNSRKIAGFMVLILVISVGEYYEILFYYPTAHDNLNIHVPVLFILAYIYGLIGAGIGSAIVLVTSGMAPFYVVYDAEPIPIARVVLDLQVTALANILGTMLLACVATRMRFVNRDLAKAVLRAEQEERQAQQLYLHAPVGLFMVDCDYRYVRINKLLADFNGVS